MKILTRVTNSIHKHKKSRAQVFILATLVIAVYTVSIIAVVTELSINRTKIDEVDVPHMVNEYLSEMNYQLEIQLINYVLNSTVTNATIINNLETFISAFSFYASSKGVATSVNLKLNQYSLSAKKMASSVVPLNPNYNKTIYISINSSIVFQSSSSGSSVSGVFFHYYGINIAANSAMSSITITEKDFYGNTIQFISGATFTTPASTVTDNGDGTYIGSFSNGINCTLTSGLEFLS